MEARELGGRQKRQRDKSPYFIQPARGGEFTVLRRPAGNRATPKECGTMPGRHQALELIRQLERAESVVSDLFLEATDDGIEALEAVLQACRESVLSRPAAAAREGDGARGNRSRRGRGRRRGPAKGRPAPEGRGESPAGDREESGAGESGGGAPADD
jgi:hypothetical protein